MPGTIGWDIGGAHLKAARVEDGQVVKVVQIACPLWLGLDQLHEAFAEAKAALGSVPHHFATMTGELSDVFPNRRAGVAAIAAAAVRELGPVRFYAGPQGFVAADQVVAHVEAVASANWHASAVFAARQVPDGLFVDVGSTTTDIIPLQAGKVAARGYSDATRMAQGELVYAGIVRSFLMAGLHHVPFGGRWVPIMNEAFATASDVYRILGDLPEDADLMPTADVQPKTAEASRARLARQIGHDASDVSAAALDRLAAYFAEAQLREIFDGTCLALSVTALDNDAPIVGAGAGRFVVRRLAARLGRPYIDCADLLPTAPELRRKAADCLPACAVALLA
ncbi:H4MPT-linked C1 transfer pathway protein [Methylovirgula ligni]|uniref:Putative H4MPT-linked C1 transfer pathway protein n=1 Tax=Methylovirgula ligni TaxID=569860 RepID=A0A3D9Z2D3_9HYPH|nr:hydantoinase/oxoprolinase family protein [Methylovirgula ligni]QAY95354.1 H4MPT-linked C1 transfer pathway protein [Methylovirgula ligni]REF89334.1 putative H4MPT-linked C1 transfer pathway protein [Methylovirgula ligni]